MRDQNPAIDKGHFNTCMKWMRHMVEDVGPDLGITTVARMRGMVVQFLRDSGWKPDQLVLSKNNPRVYEPGTLRDDLACAEMGRRLRNSSFSRMEERFLNWAMEQRGGGVASRTWEGRNRTRSGKTVTMTESTLRRMIRKIIVESGVRSNDMQISNSIRNDVIPRVLSGAWNASGGLKNIQRMCDSLGCDANIHLDSFVDELQTLLDEGEWIPDRDDAFDFKQIKNQRVWGADPYRDDGMEF